MRDKTDEIIRILRRSGAVAAGVAENEPAPDNEMSGMERWITLGYHAGMEYMTRNGGIRQNPEGLLEGARSIVSLAFNYTPGVRRDKGLPRVASFAYGRDYHDVLKKRLKDTVESLRGILGGEWRICTDSAPMLERYRAVKCGIGKRADNGLVSVYPYGTKILLAELLTTVPSREFFSGDRERGILYRKLENIGGVVPEDCLHCGVCRKVCPTGALQENGTVDARICLSYLTIEHHGEWDERGQSAMSTEAGKATLFGCDMCQDCCPLNKSGIPTDIAEFEPIAVLSGFTKDKVAGMTREDFSEAFRGSAIKRTKLEGLLRNAENLK